MGNSWSKWIGNAAPNAQKHAEPELLTTPWRKTKGWNHGLRCELKNCIAGLAPKTKGHDVPFFNIALTGQIGAGKSSFFNSINSIYQEQVSTKAEVGSTAKSLTDKFWVYKIDPHPDQPDSTPLPWRICDTMGLDPGNDLDHDVTNILKAVDGHIPDRFQFLDKEILQEKSSGYKAEPELKDKAHCVAVVIDGHGINQMSDTMKRKLRKLRMDLITRNIPTYILITHIDEECVEVSKDVSKVYHSTVIRNLVQKVSKMLHGLPENQIFPIVNYKEQIDLEDAMDILLLYALRQMLYSAQSHLENKM